MSDVMDNLKRGLDLAWASLAPAFEHAMGLAIEAEYWASHQSDQAMTHIAPNYPPLVVLLAEAGRDPSERAIEELRERLTR